MHTLVDCESVYLKQWLLGAKNEDFGFVQAEQTEWGGPDIDTKVSVIYNVNFAKVGCHQVEVYI